MFSLGSVYALETGGRYDFFCDHGQDIFNAELVGEDQTHYFVKLSVSVNKIAIEKKTVLRTQLKAPPPKAPDTANARPVAVAFAGGLGFSSGRLADFSSLSPALTFYGSYSLKPRWDLIMRGDFLRFASGDAALNMMLFSAGASFHLPWRLADFRFFPGLSFGAAWLYALADGLREHSLTPAAILWLGAGRRLTERAAILIFADATYVYDRETFVLIPAIRVGVSYRL